MSVDTFVIENIIRQVEQLPPEQRLHLMQRIIQTLIPASIFQQPKPLIFGEFQGDKMSTLEDFAIAEWRPTDEELDGE